MTEPVIYLASPYSHNAAHVVDYRVNQAARVCSVYAQAGQHMYSPIVHWHYVANRFSLPTDYAFWSRHNHLMISRCDVLLVLALDGWEESTGVAGETAYARTLFRPVRWITSQEPWRWHHSPPRA